MNELIAKDHPEFQGLIDLGSCTIHTVHKAFGKGIEQYGKDIDQLCTDLHVTTGNITLGKMHKNYKSLPLALFRALVVGAKYLPLCQYAKMV